MANNSTPNGATGGVSIISYLQKQRDGVVFQETFENYNFINADGWTVLRGSPANTQAQAVAGISSWDNTAGNQSMPIAEKVITDTNVDTQFLTQVWFYDPLTTSGGLYTTSATYPGPYYKFKTNDGLIRSIGVRNGISTSFYSYAFGTSSTDAPNLASSVPRTNGWHSFSSNFSGFNLELNVDNTVVYVESNQTEPVNALYLCAGTSSDSGSSFGYFDQLSYFRNQYLFFSQTAPIASGVILYNSSNVNIAQVSNPGTPIPNLTLQPIEPSWIANLFPDSCYFEFCNVAGTVNVYRSPLMQVNPGDIYCLQQINFGRKVTTYDPFQKELQSVSQSTAGVRETNNYGLKGTVSMSIKSLQGWSWKEANDNWFLNSVQGNPFALMVDNISDNAFGVISTSAFGGSSNTVKIMQSIVGTASNTTSQFTAGNYYYLRNNANTQKQMVLLSSLTTSTLTFDQNLNWNFQPLDYVYSLQLYPFLELSGDTQKFKCDDPMIPRFMWTDTFVDYNNG